jgi:hypothetical protein
MYTFQACVQVRIVLVVGTKKRQHRNTRTVREEAFITHMVGINTSSTLPSIVSRSERANSRIDNRNEKENMSVLLAVVLPSQRNIVQLRTIRSKEAM